MADMVTVQELENAKIDARTIGESVNENKIVTPRYGVPFKSMPMIAEEMQGILGTLIAGGVPASVVLDGNQTQKEINLFGGKKYDMPVGGYPVGAKVLLDYNAMEVVSTIAGNQNNPNTDMTGWKKKDNGVSQYNTIAEGLWSTLDSELFTVSSNDADVFADLYKNIGGNPVFQNKSYPSNKWQRTKLYQSITTIHEALDTREVSIWEFANYCDKRGSENPEDWDWSEAIRVGITYCSLFTPWALTGRYSSTTLTFQAMKYRIGSPIICDWSGVTGFLTGKPILRMRGDGAYFHNELNKQYMFTLLGTTVDICGFSLTGDTGKNLYHFKLGDENTVDTKSVSGYFSDIKCFSATKFVTIGQSFDCIFDRLFATGFNNPDDVNDKCTGVHILQHFADNTNNLIFNRLHLETTYTENYTAFKLDGNTTVSLAHNIHLFGGHIESHYHGARLLDIGRSSNLSFNGVVFTDNGENTDVDLNKSIIRLNSPNNLVFRSCIAQSGYRTNAVFDPLIHKGLIELVGDDSIPSFQNCHFVGRFETGSANDFRQIIDTTNHTLGSLAYNATQSTFQSFARHVNINPILFTARNHVNRKLIIQFSDDGTILKIGSGNGTNNMVVSDVATLNTSGTFNTKNVTAETLQTTGKVTVAEVDIVGVQPRLKLSTTGVLGEQSLYATSAGRVAVKTTNFFSIHDASNELYTATPSDFSPALTAAKNLGKSSNTWKDVFTQNAPTVVSDERRKSNIQTIPSALLDAWGDLNFNMWQLNTSITEKGESEARYHFGLIAQQVRDVLIAHGLDWTRYGLITYESWDAIEEQEAVYDSENNLISEAIEPREAGEIYMLRMEECFAVEAAYQRRRLDQIEASLVEV